MLAAMVLALAGATLAAFVWPQMRRSGLLLRDGVGAEATVVALDGDTCFYSNRRTNREYPCFRATGEWPHAGVACRSTLGYYGQANDAPLGTTVRIIFAPDPAAAAGAADLQVRVIGAGRSLPVRGAFTGAHEHKAGLFEVADRGTLFLDEVGELPLSVQATLLRALELGEIQRVGSLETRRVDVEVIAATNRALIAEVAAGRCRRDLYYRLNITELRIPPLRERREDIPAWPDAFRSDCASRWNKTVSEFTPAALDLLVQARWDGNVRELRNVVRVRARQISWLVGE